MDRPLVRVGADGGSDDPCKGADLFLDALKNQRARVADTPLATHQLAVFGQSRTNYSPDLGFPFHFTGRIHDDLCLRLFSSAAAAFVIPSRQDNLPNTGLEAQAFATGWLVDIADDRVSGALAEPFDPASLASSIRWVLEDPARRRQLGAAARQGAERL